MIEGALGIIADNAGKAVESTGNLGDGYFGGQRNDNRITFAR